jgi:hypothetical protein
MKGYNAINFLALSFFTNNMSNMIEKNAVCEGLKIFNALLVYIGMIINKLINVPHKIFEETKFIPPKKA